MDLQRAHLHLTGETVPATGIYSVHHAEHRLACNVILFGEEPFPCCAKCDVAVKFVLEKSVAVEYLPERVYELPDLDDLVQQADSAGSTG